MSNKIQGNYNLELKFVDDRVFLNFWDSIKGQDVCCQIIDGKLFQFLYSQSEIENDEFGNNTKIENIFEQKEVPMNNFIALIQKSISGDF